MSKVLFFLLFITIQSEISTVFTSFLPISKCFNQNVVYQLTNTIEIIHLQSPHYRIFWFTSSADRFFLHTAKFLLHCVYGCISKKYQGIIPGTLSFISNHQAYIAFHLVPRFSFSCLSSSGLDSQCIADL